MTLNRADGSTRDVLVCADVLGAFGVTPADVRTQTDPTPGDRSLERTLAGALQDARDRTAMLRQFICRSSRGIDCSARYSARALANELAAAFAAIDWSIDVLARGERLEVRATDGSGRRRETEFEYPETPLERDNLPAVLGALNEEVLYGVDARFVMLSAGVDRWRAALIERDELDGVRERYGDRVPVFERPLLPEYGIDAYGRESEATGRERERESENGNENGDDSETGPWPPWALEQAQRSTAETHSNSNPNPNPNSSESDDNSTRVNHSDSSLEFIEEAEPERSGAASGTAVAIEGSEMEFEAETETQTKSRPPESETDGSTSTSTLISDAETENSSEPTGNGTTTDATGNETTTESNGLVIAGGSPTVSRVSGRETSDRDDGERNPTRPRSRTATDESGRSTETAGHSSSSSTSRTDRSAVVSRSESENRKTGTDGFGTLSGSTKTARVTNDSFGADVETPTDDDRYRALGAAIGTGKNVSVKGLLDDDEFLPELPAAEPVETRIEFAEEFDPSAVSKAKATAEESGFEWISSGSLETTRVSNG